MMQFDTCTSEIYTADQYCNTCGKPRWWLGTDEPTTGLCQCGYDKKVENPLQPLQGWQCPVCKKVYAPWVASCGDPHIEVTTTNITGVW